jgi:sugar transferase (PEP-CTERM/EpsH1 system associated)
VSLACWLDDPKDVDHTHVLGRICRGSVVAVPMNPTRAKARALWALTKGSSFSQGYYYSSQFQSVVDGLVDKERPDVIYVFSSPMAQYVKGAASTTPTIVDFVDVDSEKWRELARLSKFPLSEIYRLEHPRLAQFEIEISRWARRSLFVSKAEADLFRARGGQGTILALPNGVELALQRLQTADDLRPGQRTVETTSRPIHILFVGTMNYFPNTDAVLYFAREIFPQIRSRFPQAVFDIVGRLPPRSVRRLGAIHGIQVHGEVEETRSFLVQADVSIAPMRIARGVPNKILEAMAVGVPVVATTEAVKGICVTDGEEALLADTPEAFAAQMIRLLSDRYLRSQITKRARQRVQEMYNWKTIGNQLADLVQEIVAIGGPGSFGAVHCDANSMH